MGPTNWGPYTPRPEEPRPIAKAKETAEREEDAETIRRESMDSFHLISGAQLQENLTKRGAKKGGVSPSNEGRSSGTPSPSPRPKRLSSEKDWMNRMAMAKLTNTGKPESYTVHKEWDYNLKRFRRVARPDTFYMDPKYYAEKQRVQLRLSPLSAIPGSCDPEEPRVSARAQASERASAVAVVGVAGLTVLEGPGAGASGQEWARPGPRRAQSARGAPTPRGTGNQVATTPRLASARMASRTDSTASRWVPPGTPHDRTIEETFPVSPTPTRRPCPQAGHAGRGGSFRECEAPTPTPRRSYTPQELQRIRQHKDGQWKKAHRGVPPGPRTRRERALAEAQRPTGRTDLQPEAKEIYENFLSNTKWILTAALPRDHASSA